MAKFIKSHSNYVLKSKHQLVNDGTIWERDITTIGGVNQFSPSQTPIYRSGNFIITVRDDTKKSNQYNTTKWKGTDDGDIWTLETVENLASKDERQDDTKIVLKQDYYDFRDFAYYGSLTELFRASVNDIIRRFPGELYVTNSNVYYTSGYTEDFERIEESIKLGDDDETNYVVNPFGINVHGIRKPDDGEELKFFADSGYKNYEIIHGDSDSGNTINDWMSRIFYVVVEKQEILDGKFGGKLDGAYSEITKDYFYTDYMRPMIEDYLRGEPDDEIWWTENHNDEISGYSYNGASHEKMIGKSGWDELTERVSSGCSLYTNSRFHIFHLEDNGLYTDLTPNVSGDSSGFSTNNYAQAKINELCPRPEREETETIEEYRERYEAWKEEIKKYEIYQYNPCCNLNCYFITCFNKGDKIGSVSANTSEFNATVWLGDDDITYYLTKAEYVGIHIRPIKKFIDKFYNDCDNFEYLLMNPKSTPLYKSVFSVIRENDYGYYRELMALEFPKSDGGYNIDASDYGFNDYTSKMVEIGEYYDENFSDNLYRSMTHEAIKNFDWTYKREFENGEEEEYVAGGEKFQKTMRVFAREFDELLAYINNIKNVHNVSYDERNNIPDYFLTDVVSNDGWDVKLVLPYELTEYYYDENGDKQIVAESAYTQGDCDETGQLSNTEEINGKIYNIYREFAQLSKNTVKPYEECEYPNGYYITCDKGECDITPCYYETDEKYCYKLADSSSSTWYDGSALSEKGVLKNRIKPYSNPREYTFMDANNEFLRRLKINSRSIWRHKGTIDGIEMIMAMFGLKSKRWAESVKDCTLSKDNWDFDITEYTSFTYRIEEQWDAIHQKYRIEWINSTKAITYDNRTISNYSTYGSSINTIAYEGIPVSYRDEYVYTDSDCTSKENYKPYIKMSSLIEIQPSSGQTPTNDISKTFKRIDENNAPVVRRYLYPNFDKTEELDGNPYFQMDGGWFSKTIDAFDIKHNFQYDVDNNIVSTNYVSAGTVDENESVVDNEALYRETIRNIRRVDNVAALLKIPNMELFDGAVIYVTKIETNAAIIDNEVYEIKREWVSDDNGSGYTASYISLIKTDGLFTVGGDKFFDRTMMVFDENGNPIEYDGIEEMSEGTEIKAYIRNGLFMCQEDEDGYYAIENFIILDEYADSEDTNYFKLNDVNYSNVFAVEDENGNWSDGWRRLKVSDKEYLKINTIFNYYKGNNGHNGNMRYDSGHEYFTYFKRLFKDAIDNSRFDERCYIDYWKNLDEEIFYYGFKNLIEDNENILQYARFLNEDKKIHYFGNYKSGNTVYIYGENCERINNFKQRYALEGRSVSGYILNDDTKTIDGSNNPYSNYKEYVDEENGIRIPVDEVTNQIMNNKRIKITFNLHYDWFTKEGQEELKYIDDIVLSYLEQMVPSTVIVDVEYKNKDNGCSCNGLRIWFKEAVGCKDITLTQGEIEEPCDCNDLNYVG